MVVNETLKQLVYRHRNRCVSLTKFNSFLEDLFYNTTKENNKYYSTGEKFREYFEHGKGKEDIVQFSKNLIENALQGIDLTEVEFSYETNAEHFCNISNFRVICTLVIEVKKYNFVRKYDLWKVFYDYEGWNHDIGVCAFSNRFRGGETTTQEGFSDVKLKVRKDIKEVLEILR